MLISDFGKPYDTEFWFSYRKESDSMFVESTSEEKHITAPETFLIKYAGALWELQNNNFE